MFVSGNREKNLNIQLKCLLDNGKRVIFCNTVLLKLTIKCLANENGFISKTTTSADLIEKSFVFLVLVFNKRSLNYIDFLF